MRILLGHVQLNQSWPKGQPAMGYSPEQPDITLSIKSFILIKVKDLIAFGAVSGSGTLDELHRCTWLACACLKALKTAEKMLHYPAVQKQ